ncbi:ABC-2 type transport system ATP-binding protein [Amphibacillus marinus]|uniref:ABC-2 type transport system ATP-binding protein n=1 Tax=Amphibacillus marinus TaxID=872970 RepID=A0A1H8K703_9BACI|nr:ABC transporter ATP-binding protein [Amphibacillus marinus]SEN88188.1 ABC-2 type transport system ATP-binding protein [Amphibacillus marinus]
MTIKLRNVNKGFVREVALQNVNLTFGKGKIYGLVGPNGSGKSTILKLMTGLVFPSKGEVILNGQVVTRQSAEQVSYLTELDMHYEGFTVTETINYVASQFKSFNKKKAEQLLKTLKLDPTKKIKKLSKGNRGRLKLVTALARDTDVILLDEPFSGLDPMVREETVKSLLQYVDLENQVIIIATHEIAEIEPLLDEIIVLYYGEVLGQENVEILREEHGQSVLDWFKTTIRAREDV